MDSSPKESSGMDFAYSALKGIVSIFVTPMSLLAAMFIISYHCCANLFDQLKQQPNPISIDVIKIGIYTSLFIMTFTAVCTVILTFIKPENLIYDKLANLTGKGLAPYGTDETTKQTKTKKSTTPASDI